MLLKINERGRWTDPPPADEAQRAQQDEEIFQTARLINCGHFMALIFGDYVAGFLGLTRDGCTWSMNPFDVSGMHHYRRNLTETSERFLAYHEGRRHHCRSR